MGTYRKEWPCCGSVTETEAWEPKSCPFCTPIPSLPSTESEIMGLSNDAVSEALQFMVDRFGPCENEYIFSKRLAIQKARAALAAKTATREEKPIKALLLMDDVDDLIRWASCHAPVELYNKSSSAFWKVCHMIAGTSKPAPACAANPVQPSTGEVDVEAERKLFEACMKPGYLSRCTEPGYTDQYADSYTQMAWKAWLAARRTQAEGARDAVRKAFKELVKKHTHRRPRIVGNDVEYRNEIDTYQIGRDVIDAAIAAIQGMEKT